MAGIIFEDYLISEASYKKNFKFDVESESSLSSEIKCKISIQENITAQVILECEIGSISEGNSPFEVKSTIVGLFNYNPSESENVSFENLLVPNAIAILFPYLRASISQLTTLSNDFPNLNIPVMNIAHMLQEKGLIEIEHL